MSGLEVSGDRRKVVEVTLQEEGLGLPSCEQGLQVHRLGSVLGWDGPAIDLCPNTGPGPQLYPQENHDRDDKQCSSPKDLALLTVVLLVLTLLLRVLLPKPNYPDKDKRM